MNDVSVEWLRTAAEVLLRHLEETQGPSITLKQNYFWSMASTDRYDVTTQPSDLTIGSLTDGAEFVQSMVQNDAVLNYGLVWLGAAPSGGGAVRGVTERRVRAHVAESLRRLASRRVRRDDGAVAAASP